MFDVRIVWICAAIFTSTHCQDEVSGEYCDYDVFEPSCGSDETILITHAMYGRMNFGRCVQKNYGYLGCATDVTALLGQLCSGPTCSVSVGSLRDEAADTSCSDELLMYLEASYICVPAAVAAPVIREYCENDVFEASCEPGEEIQITQALYGRMQLGRCLHVNLGYVGCGTDVTATLGQLCTGSACAVDVATLRDNVPVLDCLEELVMYMEASYQCIPAAGVAPVIREYCESDVFEASCGPAEQIQIIQALYGRMRLSRCLQVDLGYIGCWTDVTATLGQLCTGSACAVDVATLKDDVPGLGCPEELVMYLEASYQCIPDQPDFHPRRLFRDQGDTHRAHQIRQ